MVSAKPKNTMQLRIRSLPSMQAFLPHVTERMRDEALGTSSCEAKQLHSREPLPCSFVVQEDEGK